MGNSWLVEGAHLPLFGKVGARGQGPGAQGWPGAGWPAARAAFLAQQCFYRNSRRGLLTRLPGSGASVSGLEINVSAFKDGDRETVRGHRHGASAQRLCLVLRAATDCKGRCLLQTTSVTNGSFQEHSAVPAPKAFPHPGGGGREVVREGPHVCLLDLPPRHVPAVCPRSDPGISRCLPHPHARQPPAGWASPTARTAAPSGFGSMARWATCPHRELPSTQPLWESEPSPAQLWVLG